MERRDNGNSGLPQKRQQVDPRPVAVDAELMLDAEDISILEIQEIPPPKEGIPVVFVDLETDPGRVGITLLPIIDGNNITLGIGCGGSN